MSDQSIVHGSQSKKDTSFDPTRPWLRHYEQGVPAELEIPDRPLTWLLDQTVSDHAGHTAFIYYGTKLSYAQFSSLANRFATGLPLFCHRYYAGSIPLRSAKSDIQNLA